jgi:hypothetical protein
VSAIEVSLHCAECQVARVTNRTGWCADCKAFVAASDCTWGPGKYVFGLLDLSCPGCGKRWCFGLEDLHQER